MRFLIVGAGGLGGYFGARLIEAGEDVTFLLRPRRAAQLAETGLVVRSPFGDTTLRDLKVVSRESLMSNADPQYDLILVGCKAYDLDDTMDAFAPAVGPQTMLLPVLNGMSHIQRLAERFGAEHVLGGYCLISAALDGEGFVQHYNKMHKLSFGEWGGGLSERVQNLARIFEKANFDGICSTHIEADMWDKWTQIASLAGMTCLMRSPVGDIVQSGGAAFAIALYEECLAIARANGHEPSEASIARIKGVLTDPASQITASMCKDLERGARVEAQHLIGDMIARRPVADAGASLTPGMLDVVYLNLKTYERRRAD